MMRQDRRADRLICNGRTILPSTLRLRDQRFGPDLDRSVYGFRRRGAVCLLLTDAFVLSAPLSLPPSTASESPSLETSPNRWFTEEVHPHGAQLKSYLRGKFPGVRDVEDVVQESYLRIWQARAAHPIRSVKSFLFQIARHVAVDLVRRDRASPFISLGDLEISSVTDSGPDAAAALSDQERLDLLSDALVALPDRCRDVILLHKIHGLPQKEVALRLGVSPRTVENHCHQGLIRLENYMRTHGVHGFALD